MRSLVRCDWLLAVWNGVLWGEGVENGWGKYDWPIISARGLRYKKYLCIYFLFLRTPTPGSHRDWDSDTRDVGDDFPINHSVFTM